MSVAKSGGCMSAFAHRHDSQRTSIGEMEGCALSCAEWLGRGKRHLEIFGGDHGRSAGGTSGKVGSVAAGGCGGRGRALSEFGSDRGDPALLRDRVAGSPTGTTAVTTDPAAADGRDGGHSVLSCEVSSLRHRLRPAGEQTRDHLHRWALAHSGAEGILPLLPEGFFSLIG